MVTSRRSYGPDRFPASPAEYHAAANAAIFTAFMREIRRTVNACARRRGRRLRIAARTPHNLRECLGMGIDLAAWLEDRSLDLRMLGDGNLTNALPIEDAVALAHAHDVAVYPCLNWYKPDPVTWGWAASAYAKGVDGMINGRLLAAGRSTVRWPKRRADTASCSRWTARFWDMGNTWRRVRSRRCPSASTRIGCGCCCESANRVLICARPGRRCS